MKGWDARLALVTLRESNSPPSNPRASASVPLALLTVRLSLAVGHPEKLALFYIPSRHVAKAEKLPRDYSKALEAFQCPLSPAATEMVAKLKKYMRVLLKTVLAVAPKVGVVM